MLHILFSVSIRFACYFVMFLWFYISWQFCVFIIASNTLLFHLEICYKKKPFLALKRLFPFGTRHLTPVQTIPFPAAVSFAYYLQKKKKTSVWVFTLCIDFPFMTVVVVILNRCFDKPTDKDSNEESFKLGFSEIFEETYRNKVYWWETWTLYERMTVSLLKTFLIDPVVRLFADTLVLLLFL